MPYRYSRFGSVVTLFRCVFLKLPVFTRKCDVQNKHSNVMPFGAIWIMKNTLASRLVRIILVHFRIKLHAYLFCEFYSSCLTKVWNLCLVSGGMGIESSHGLFIMGFWWCLSPAEFHAPLSYHGPLWQEVRQCIISPQQQIMHKITKL